MAWASMGTYTPSALSDLLGDGGGETRLRETLRRRKRQRKPQDTSPCATCEHDRTCQSECEDFRLWVDPKLLTEGQKKRPGPKSYADLARKYA